MVRLRRSVQRVAAWTALTWPGSWSSTTRRPIVRALAANLKARGYEVDLAATGEQALDLAARHHPDVVMLDLGLPGIDGLEVIAGPAGLDPGADHRAVGPGPTRPTRSPPSTPAPTTT